MRALHLPALLIVTALATVACSKDMQDQQPAPVAPPVGASNGPNTMVGHDYSPGSGSISNGASGSSILLQEGGGLRP
jgi:hypothetical protein